MSPACLRPFFCAQIDTEGFDATVIQGAMESITHGSIGIISFEYHEVRCPCGREGLSSASTFEACWVANYAPEGAVEGPRVFLFIV